MSRALVVLGAVGALLSWGVGCGGGPTGAPGRPSPPPPTVEVSVAGPGAEPGALPADPGECRVVVELRKLVSDGGGGGVTAEEARAHACDAACLQLDPERVQDCRSSTRFELVAWESSPSYSLGGATDFSYYCRAFELNVKAHTARSPAGLSPACRLAYQALCPAEESCQDAGVRSVAGVPVARLAELLAAGGFEREPRRAGPSPPASRCELVVAVHGAEVVGEASDAASGKPDMAALRKQARAAACQKIGLDERRCADADGVHTLSTSQQLSFKAGHGSGTVKVTMAQEQMVKAGGSDNDPVSACLAAVAEACRSAACRDASAITVRELNGVPVWPSGPERPDFNLFDHR